MPTTLTDEEATELALLLRHMAFTADDSCGQNAVVDANRWAAELDPPKQELELVFTNVNEDGETYGQGTLEEALRLLGRFPNDSIVITYQRKEPT